MSLLEHYGAQLEQAVPLAVRGQVEAVKGLIVHAADLPMPVDAAVDIRTASGTLVPGQVVGFDRQRTLIMALGSMQGIARGDMIFGRHGVQRVPCSDFLVGRVIDAFGHPLDGKGPVAVSRPRSIAAPAIDCMRRVPIHEPISTGVRAVDALLTCGQGQRMGIFAGPGVGKSVFMSMLARCSSAAVSVIALIGERGREVQDFLQHTLGEAGLARSVVVASTADQSPLVRIRAARVASTIAEHFRDAGRNVLLVMDSLTRLCQAQRQVGLSIGEPPATRGYTPSVFALLPEILERAGNTARGSITGFYTVLVEGDDFNEPIADAVKGITDGHIFLDRALANRGHYPAVSMLQSISRVRNDVTDAPHQAAARRVLELLAAYADIEDLVNIGAYVPGGSLINDLSVRMRERIVAFLQQKAADSVNFASAKVQLFDLQMVIEREQKLLEQNYRQVAAAAPAAKPRR